MLHLSRNSWFRFEPAFLDFYSYFVSKFEEPQSNAQQKHDDANDEREGVERFPPSSEDNAGFISGLLFSYVGSYWWRTRNAKDDSELLEKPSKRITAHYAANKLERYILVRKRHRWAVFYYRAWAENGVFNRGFLAGVWRSTRGNVIIHAFTLCLEEATRVAQPLLLKNLMGYYDIEEYAEFPFWLAIRGEQVLTFWICKFPYWFALCQFPDAALISILSFVTVFIHHPYFHGLLKVGNDTRVGTGVLLYKKALRLSLTSLSKTNSGQLIQLLNTDAAKMEQAFLFIHYVWLCPLLAIFYAFVLWYFFGPCCLIGFSVMMVIVSFQVYFSYKLGMNRYLL